MERTSQLASLEECARESGALLQYYSPAVLSLPPPVSPSHPASEKERSCDTLAAPLRATHSTSSLDQSCSPSDSGLQRRSCPDISWLIPLLTRLQDGPLYNDVGLAEYAPHAIPCGLHRPNGGEDDGTQNLPHCPR